MTFKIVGQPLKTVLGDRAEEYHHFLYANGLIWAFSQKFHQQPTYNWGHRVAHKGGYAIAYDTAKNKWGDAVQFDAVTLDENVDEVLFVLDDKIYMLLFTGFGQVAPLKLLSWNGSSWEEKNLEFPPYVKGSEQSVRVTAHVVDGTSAKERYIVFNMDSVVRLFKLSLGDGGQATIGHIADVPAEINPMRAMAISGVHAAGRVIISIAVLGCGYRWEKSRFIVYNESTDLFQDVLLPDEAAETVPPFSFTSSAGHGLAQNGDWIHAGGCKQVGIEGGQFEGSVWALTDLSGVPKWQRLDITIPSEVGGSSVIASNKIYFLSDSVAATSLP